MCSCISMYIAVTTKDDEDLRCQSATQDLEFEGIVPDAC